MCCCLAATSCYAKHLEIRFPTHHEKPSLQFLNNVESALSGRSQQKISLVLLFRLVVFREMVHQIPLRVITAFQTWEDCLTFSQLERLLSFRDVNTSVHTFSSSAPYIALDHPYLNGIHVVFIQEILDKDKSHAQICSRHFFLLKKVHINQINHTIPTDSLWKIPTARKRHRRWFAT